MILGIQNMYPINYCYYYIKKIKFDYPKDIILPPWGVMRW